MKQGEKNKKKNICIHCGKEIPDEAEFCFNCGYPVREHKAENNVVQLPNLKDIAKKDILFFDKDGKACGEEDAVRFIATCYDKAGNRINETWGMVKKEPESTWKG